MESRGQIRRWTHEGLSGHRRRAAAGFSLIEVIVTTAILGLLAIIALSTFQSQVPKFHLWGTVRQCSQLISKARLEAIRHRVSTVVIVDLDAHEILAFGDRDGDLDFNPDLTQMIDRTDFLIDRVQVPKMILFAAPASLPVVDGFTPAALVTDPNIVVFTARGSVNDPGAFRFADGALNNHFEVRVGKVTGRVGILKYLHAGDSPTLTAGYFAEGNREFDETKVGENIWVWY